MTDRITNEELELCLTSDSGTLKKRMAMELKELRKSPTLSMYQDVVEELLKAREKIIEAQSIIDAEDELIKRASAENARLREVLISVRDMTSYRPMLEVIYAALEGNTSTPSTQAENVSKDSEKINI